MLQTYGVTLIISIESEQHLNQVRQNLLSYCLAIHNMNPHLSANVLPEQILKAHLNQINLKIGDREKILIDQLNCIKSLVNRTVFSLTDRQVL